MSAVIDYNFCTGGVRMLFKLVTIILLALVFVLSSVSSAVACACCAEPGTYSIRTENPDSFYIDLLKEIRFDKDAYLYMTGAGFEMMKGLSSIEAEFDDGSWAASPGGLDLVNTFNGKIWTFTIKSPKGKTGTLRLPIPSQMLTFKVDIHDGQRGGAGGPLLYKEFRFKGTVGSGSGIFGASIVRPTSYFLVFQGRGNGCDNSQDFNNWNLEITGRKARYQFFGKLSSGNRIAPDAAPGGVLGLTVE